jgi:hypothetical protein
MALPPAIKPGGGVGLKSPIGGPSGPGGSPMVSPGTGAGMQAAAKKKISSIIDELLAAGASFNKPSEEWSAVAAAISQLNKVMKHSAPTEEKKQPLPVPPAPLGGPGAPGAAPPPGLPAPTGGAMGGGPADLGMGQ